VGRWGLRAPAGGVAQREAPAAGSGPSARGEGLRAALPFPTPSATYAKHIRAPRSRKLRRAGLALTRSTCGQRAARTRTSDEWPRMHRNLFDCAFQGPAGRTRGRPHEGQASQREYQRSSPEQTYEDGDLNGFALVRWRGRRQLRASAVCLCRRRPPVQTTVRRHTLHAFPGLQARALGPAARRAPRVWNLESRNGGPAAMRRRMTALAARANLDLRYRRPPGAERAQQTTIFGPARYVPQFCLFRPVCFGAATLR
jgi:hypothetical protein